MRKIRAKLKTKKKGSESEAVIPLLTPEFMKEVRREMAKFKSGKAETYALEDVIREDG